MDSELVNQIRLANEARLESHNARAELAVWKAKVASAERCAQQLQGERDQARRDVDFLISTIEMQEALLGEGPDGEDAALIAQIKAQREEQDRYLIRGAEGAVRPTQTATPESKT